MNVTKFSLIMVSFLGLFLALGLGLRLHGLWNYELSPDEAMNVFISMHTPAEVLLKRSTLEFHTPGYFLLLWPWNTVMSLAVIGRGLSVVSGGLMIMVCGIIGKLLLPKRGWVLMLFWGTFSTAGMVLSELVRPYMIGGLLYMVALGLYVFYVRKKKLVYGVLFLIFVLLTVLVQQLQAIPFLFFPLLPLQKKKFIKPIDLVMFVLLGACLVWFVGIRWEYFEQMQNYLGGTYLTYGQFTHWSTFIKGLLDVFAYYGEAVTGVITISVGVILGSWVMVVRKQIRMWLFCVLPLVVAVVLTGFKLSTFSGDRHVFFAWPGIVLLAAYGWGELTQVLTKRFFMFGRVLLLYLLICFVVLSVVVSGRFELYKSVYRNEYVVPMEQSIKFKKVLDDFTNNQALVLVDGQTAWLIRTWAESFVPEDLNQDRQCFPYRNANVCYLFGYNHWFYSTEEFRKLWQAVAPTPASLSGVMFASIGWTRPEQRHDTFFKNPENLELHFEDESSHVFVLIDKNLMAQPVGNIGD